MTPSKGAPALLGPLAAAAVDDCVAWCAHPGTIGILEISGDPQSAAELMWSSQCAKIPSTRVVAFLTGAGSGEATEDFQNAHTTAERLAKAAQAQEGADVGPIEVLVFRPDPESATASSHLPVLRRTGAEFSFPHAGGAEVRLSLTFPAPSTADES